MVYEHLRLKVPRGLVPAWRAAEQASWEPFLAAQPGYLGRTLTHDAVRAEGVIAVRWASRAQWQAVRPGPVAETQAAFEAAAWQQTQSRRREDRVGQPEEEAGRVNPFPLLRVWESATADGGEDGNTVYLYTVSFFFFF